MSPKGVGSGHDPPMHSDTDIEVQVQASTATPAPAPGVSAGTPCFTARSLVSRCVPILRSHVAAMLAAACLAATVPIGPVHAETCARARAVDGDTIRCANGRKIRLKDVHAPELDQPGGKRARDRLGAAVNGKSFRYTPEGRSYDRDVARVPGVTQSTVGPRGGNGARSRSKR
jgi:hypothetical protein